MTHPKFEALVDRLDQKIKMSQVPVPGFIVGLSGTDSIVAFMLCHEAAKRNGIEHNVRGIHFVKSVPVMSWFSRNCIPWLQEKFRNDSGVLPHSYYLAHFTDENRWARLHEESKYWNAWTVGTMNATEKELGKYSLISTAVSLQPIQTLYKSTILEICEAYGVPRIAIDNSRIPDCLCGRDEFAAENIELIDSLLRNDPTVMDNYLDSDIRKAMEYIATCKKENGFRDRVPYKI